MRSARLLVVLGLILAPSLASAQEKNPFVNSWFWGAKAGNATLNTSNGRTQAPVFGIDWLITRDWYALNIGLDQAYFDAVSSVSNAGNAAANGVERRVDIRDMRRVSAVMDLYPRVFNQSVRPYVGIGYAGNFIVRAASEGSDFVSPAAKDTVTQRIQSAKSRGSWVLALGVQVEVKKWQPFAQATMMPMQGAGKKFLINGEGYGYYLEAGVRYNFGSSIEKLK